MEKLSWEVRRATGLIETETADYLRSLARHCCGMGEVFSARLIIKELGRRERGEAMTEERINAVAAELNRRALHDTVTPAENAVGSDGKPWTYDDEVYAVLGVIYAEMTQGLSDQDCSAIWDRSMRTL